MPFTDGEKNIVIDSCLGCISELTRVKDQIVLRHVDFVAENGDKTADQEKDLTKLTINELNLKLDILSKMRSEIVNIETAILHDLEKTDKEIMRRQE